MNNPRTRRTRIGVAIATTAVLTATIAACSSSSDSAVAPSEGGSSGSISLEADYAGTNETPPTTGPAAFEGANVWVVTCSAAIVGCQAPADNFAAAATELGWETTIVDGKFGVGDGFNAGVRQAIAANADAIVVAGIDCEQARGGLQDAKTAGIATIAVASFDCDDEQLFTASLQWNSKTPAFADFLKSYGAAKARWLIDATNGTANVLAFSQAENSTAQSPLIGFTEEMASECPDCTVVNVDFSGGDVQTGLLAQKFSAALVSNPAANSVMTVFDSFYQIANVSAATASAGRQFQIAGGEGLAEGLDAVRDGRVDTETGYDNAWSGYGIADTVNRALQGAPQVPQGIGWQTIDADNNLPDQGPYVAPVDYKSAYRTLWGLS